MGKINVKYLINPDHRVMMKGEFIKTSTIVEDFIYQSKKDQLPIILMKSIAAKNNFTVGGRKADEIKVSFNRGLSTLAISEKNEMSTTEKVAQIVKDGMEDELSEDQILIKIVMSGVKFQRAAKMMSSAMVELGFAVSAKDRYSKSKTIMEDDGFEPENYEEVEAMAEVIIDKVKGTSTIQAVAQIRKYCREFEVDFPRRVTARPMPRFLRSIIWLLDNLQEADSDSFEKWMVGDGFSDTSRASWQKHLVKIQEHFNETSE